MAGMSTLDLGEVSLAYAVEGEGAPVLMLHGHGGWRDSWELQVAALAPRYRTLRMDLRGHGDSSKPAGPYTMGQLAADAAAVIRHAAGARAHVLGHSLGGAVALQLALDAPELVRSLVIINSQASFVRPRGIARIAAAGATRVPRLLGFRLHARAIAWGYLKGKHLAARRAQLIEGWSRNELAGYLAAASATEEFDVRARLGEISVPVLVVGSDRDVLPLEAKRALASGVRQGRLVMISDSRHIALWDQPAALNREILEFLAGAP